MKSSKTSFLRNCISGWNVRCTEASSPLSDSQFLLLPLQIQKALGYLVRPQLERRCVDNRELISNLLVPLLLRESYCCWGWCQWHQPNVPSVALFSESYCCWGWFQWHQLKFPSVALIFESHCCWGWSQWHQLKFPSVALFL